MVFDNEVLYVGVVNVLVDDLNIVGVIVEFY